MGVGCGRGVTLGLAVPVGAGVVVEVGGGVSVAVAVGVAVGVGGTVGVGDGVPEKWHQTILAVSTRQPSLEPVLSLAIRQRSTAFASSGDRSTTVVIKPSEFPLQA
jgi:sugar/nucleoside kinase (ribokinase family)